MAAALTGAVTATAVVAALGSVSAANADPPQGTYCQLPATAQLAARPWAQQRLGFERVWPVSTGAGITVAVVDTGVDANQPYLAQQVVRPGVDIVNGGGADTDCVGHGTLVAGLIVGRRLPGSGFAGVAPGASVLPIRQTDNGYDGTPHTLAAGIDAAVAAHARVINVSITYAQSTPELQRSVADALAKGVVVVAAAGNDQQQGNAPEYPASYPGVISVGAVGPDGRPADFSSSGTPVSVAAPGAEIVGPGAGGSALIGGQQGTSFAAPFVAGVAALILAQQPGLTPAQVAHRIEATAEHPAGALPDAKVGFGIVDPYAAVTAVLPEESGTRAVAGKASGVVLGHPAAVDHGTEISALRLAGVAVGVVAVLPFLAVARRQVRRRGV